MNDDGSTKSARGATAQAGAPPSDAGARRAVLQNALATIERLQARVSAAESALREPIAIVGLACRTPGGVTDAASYWSVLSEGRDVVSEVPEQRWDSASFYDPNPKAIGKSITKSGGFLNDVDQFDAPFFGISPREAAGLDPQHRILLEVCWEALENAAIPADRLDIGSTGVFIGITSTDYASRIDVTDPVRSDVYLATGTALNAAAGRISYALGLQGPCMAIDTACSSSLVSIHTACQSLRAGDSNLALAGGVNIMLDPTPFVLISKWGMLSPDGRCKAFDASANGFVRGEGCGIVVLERLSDAVAKGRNILAVIRGSSINQDGRSSGLTVPNGLAQQAVVRRALDNAQLKPADVSYVEAHGTGTSLGDPIEVEALAAVYGDGRATDSPLEIGSVKSNIGHLEAAAGVTSLIKVVLSLQHRQIPASLHVRRPTPAVSWDSIPVRVSTALHEWRPIDGRRIAGVSGFGFSGMNAHVLIEEAPAAEAAPVPTERMNLVPLSARSDTALAALAGRLATTLDAPNAPTLADVATTMADGRAHQTRRMALLAESREELVRALREVAAGEKPAGSSSGLARPAERPKIAFLFTGQGAQYAGMGRALYDSEPVFRAALDRAAAALDGQLDRPLLGVMFASDADAGLINETGYTQPALFALQYALVEQWRHWGVRPSMVAGHSVGEFAAALTAGVFSLDDGAALIAARGRLMQALPAGGAMAAVFAPWGKVEAILAGAHLLSMGAINGPEETVVSGDKLALDDFLAKLSSLGIASRPLEVSHAFHSPLLDPMLDAFEARARETAQRAPNIQLVSNLSGKPFASGEKPDAAYWRRHAREPVRFTSCLESLADAGVDAIVEIGPHPTLLALTARARPDAQWAAVASLRRGRSDRGEMLAGLGRLYTRGAAIDWPALAADGGGRRAPLPTYPFERQHYWLGLPDPSEKASSTSSGHPLLGARQVTPQPGAQFVTMVDLRRPSFLADHVVLGATLLPGAAFAEIGFAAAQALGRQAPFALRDLSIESPLALASDAARWLHVTAEPELESRTKFAVSSAGAADGADGPWTIHARGAIAAVSVEAPQDLPRVNETRPRCTDAQDVDAYYQGLREIGLEYGPSFLAVRALNGGDGEAVGVIERRTDGDDNPYTLHPALLDSAFHVLGAALAKWRDGGGSAYVPVGMREIVMLRAAGDRLHVAAKVTSPPDASGGATADIALEDDDGALVGWVKGLEIRKISADTLAKALAIPGVATRAFDLDWRPLTRTPAASLKGSSFLLVGDVDSFAATLASGLAEQGARTATIDAAAFAAASDSDVASLVNSTGVTSSWLIDCTQLDAASGDAAADARDRSLRALAIAKRLDAASPRVGHCILTRGALAVAPGDIAEVAQSAALGLARTVAAERPSAHSLRLDLDPATPPDAKAVVAVFTQGPRSEPDVASRHGALLSPRLRPLAARGEPGTTRQVLRIPTRGALDALRLDDAPRRAPGPGEVEIEVRACALNFRDVLNALGSYPGDPGPLGSECAGVITAVGPGVDHLRVGQEVAALGPESFATHATFPAGLVVDKPPTLGFADAATLGNAYLTAAYSILVRAGLKTGQTLLAHAATGGVGLAALRLARRIGANVIATAGSPEKRAIALAQGASHAFDSRSASFYDEVMKATGGEGVDVVLNALSGDLIDAGFKSLRPGGYFIEIGKRGIWTAEEAADKAPHARYAVVDLGEEIERDPREVRDMFADIVKDVAEGRLAPLPVRAFLLDDAVAAFRFMATARHVGKVILTPRRREPVRIEKDGTYLVTGGLGGVGLKIAERLAEKGAGEIVLVGRKGATTEQEEALSRLRALGANVTVAACDIADPAALRRLWTETIETRPRLRGIVHAAGALSDAALGNQDAERFEISARPKIDGAWALHEISKGRRYDFFIMFSSTSALFGSPGQANYAAANGFLDGLAAHRRARGLEGLSIGWGAWGEVGMAAQLPPEVRDRWARIGVGAMTPSDALDALEAALAGDQPYATIMAVDPARFAREAPPTAKALFGAASTAPSAQAGAGERPKQNALATIKSAAPGERPKAIEAFIHREVARVLGYDAASLDSATPLTSIGFNSLMAVQLRNLLTNELGVDLQMATLFRNASVAALATEVGLQLNLGESGGAEPEAAWEGGTL